MKGIRSRPTDADGVRQRVDDPVELHHGAGPAV